MDSAVTVAVVGAAGAIVGPTLGYVIARQAANDRRTNTTRDIETLAKLDRSTDTAKKLSDHIAASIERTIEREQLKDQLTSTLTRYLVLNGFIAVLYGLGKWLQVGPPKDFKLAIEIVYFGMIALGLWILAGFIVSTARLAWLYIKGFILKIRLRNLKKKVAQQQSKSAAMDRQIQALRSWLKNALKTVEKEIADRENPTDKRLARIAELGGEQGLNHEIDSLNEIAREMREKLAETDPRNDNLPPSDDSNPLPTDDELPRPR